MSQIEDFGDDEQTTQTVGPITNNVTKSKSNKTIKLPTTKKQRTCNEK